MFHGVFLPRLCIQVTTIKVHFSRLPCVQPSPQPQGQSDKGSSPGRSSVELSPHRGYGGNRPLSVGADWESANAAPIPCSRSLIPRPPERTGTPVQRCSHSLLSWHSRRSTAGHRHSPSGWPAGRSPHSERDRDDSKTVNGGSLTSPATGTN